MELHKDVVDPKLDMILNDIMSEHMFDDFRLVGGTNLALRAGHRISTDIDLFTDNEYGSVDFGRLEEWLKSKYGYFDVTDNSSVVGRGRSYYVGSDRNNAIKLDIMYENEKFLFPAQIIGKVRMASVEEIAVMKLDAIFRGGRKKDFWDLHYLVVDMGLDLKKLIDFHAVRFEYQHDYDCLVKKLQDFSIADDEPDPICRYGKYWEVVKLDIIDIVSAL